MPEKTRRVFLSYSRADAPFVREVVGQLQERGVDTWLDEARLEAGTRWADTLAEALASAQLLVVFISSATLDSPSVNFEIGAALGRQKRVVAVYLTERARRDAPPILSTAQGIDARALKPEEVAEQIADAVKAA